MRRFLWHSDWNLHTIGDRVKFLSLFFIIILVEILVSRISAALIVVPRYLKVPQGLIYWSLILIFWANFPTRKCSVFWKFIFKFQFSISSLSYFSMYSISSSRVNMVWPSANSRLCTGLVLYVYYYVLHSKCDRLVLVLLIFLAKLFSQDFFTKFTNFSLMLIACYILHW